MAIWKLRKNVLFSMQNFVQFGLFFLCYFKIHDIKTRYRAICNINTRGMIFEFIGWRQIVSIIIYIIHLEQINLFVKLTIKFLKKLILNFNQLLYLKFYKPSKCMNASYFFYNSPIYLYVSIIFKLWFKFLNSLFFISY